MTRHIYRNNVLASLLCLSWNNVSIESQLTFIAPVNLRFADEGRTVALICAKEYISGVGVATPDVTSYALSASAIMPLMIVPLAIAEETVPL